MKWLSRKLFVLALATSLLCLKLVSENTWLTLAMIYLGFNSLDKFLNYILSQRMGGK